MSSTVMRELAQITAERDLDLLEGHLLRTMRALLQVSDIGWLRVDADSDSYCLTRLGGDADDAVSAAARVEGKVSGDPPEGMCRDVWSAVLRATHSEHPLRVCDEERALTLYPLRSADATLGYLLARDVREIADSALVTDTLRVFRNYYALLEENQKDKLTGLLNRKTFDERIGKLLQIVAESNRLHPCDDRRRVAAAGDERFWLAVADIDHFKRINDTFGHLYGDEVLLLLAQIMKRTFRHNDLLFRYGGEEFVIVVGATDREGAQTAFEKFRRVVAVHPFPQIDRVTVSVGATEVAQQCLIPSALFGRADEALYHAKHHGRDCLFFYEQLVATGEAAPAPDQGSVELF